MANESDKLREERFQRLELDIDTRLLDLWTDAFQTESWDLELVAAYMRAAYSKGYVDALKEPEEQRGYLTRNHGYRTPEPQALPVDPEV